ncbi:pantothenate transporter Fen2p [Trichomonascus vanleenenianus]|uniref:pantothenate transporter Fen2p n=1 Tax=Trichomonascus vanleenenianus TaxID=2268995 RepID=UPI003ECA9A04
MSSIEKNAESVSVSESQESIDTSATRAAYRKLDFILLPLLFLGFFGLQLDRGNIGNALTDTILEDLNITVDTINTGTQLLSAGIIIFEIPSNILLQKIGARRWITAQIIAWGLIATLQAFVKTRSTFLLTRFLLGVGEAGFIPGTLYYLSTFYRQGQYAKRNTIFFLGNQAGSAFSGLLSAGILRLEGKNGLAGWQWLFIIDGLITIFVGVLWFFLLPESPTNMSPLAFPRLKLLDKESSDLIIEQLLLDDKEKTNSSVRITAKDVGNVYLNWRTWQHILVTFIPMLTVQASTYFPLIVKSLGYTKLKANAMSSVGGFIQMPVLLILAWYSDYSRHRGIATIIPQALTMLFIGLLYGLKSPKQKYAAVVLTQSFMASFHVMNVTWTSANCVLPVQRSLTLAGVVMAANLGQLAGATIFGAQYAPTFDTSFIICICILGGAVVYTAAVILGYRFCNGQIKKYRAENPQEVREADQIGVDEDGNDVSAKHIAQIRRERGILYVY